MSMAASSSLSSFQLIIDEALDTYKSRTKKDLRDHPLADQLQTFDSPSAILVVLQQQAQQTEQSQSTDGRWAKWLAPTVKVLHFFVKVLGAAGGTVCLKIYYFSCSLDLLPHIYVAGITILEPGLCRNWRTPFSVYSYRLRAAI